MVHLPGGKPSAKKNTAAGFPRGSYLGIAANRPLFLRRIVTAAAKVLRCGKNIRQTIMGVHKVEKLKNDGAFYKRFFSLTITIALQNLIVFSVNLADNLMLGGYSEQALSGVALANQIQFLLQMLVMGAGEGMIVLASQYWGKKRNGTHSPHYQHRLSFWLGGRVAACGNYVFLSLSGAWAADK